MSAPDLVKRFDVSYRQYEDGALRVRVLIDNNVFQFSPEQAEQLETRLHAETQKAVERVARELDRFAS